MLLETCKYLWFILAFVVLLIEKMLIISALISSTARPQWHQFPPEHYCNLQGVFRVLSRTNTWRQRSRREGLLVCFANHSKETCNSIIQFTEFCSLYSVHTLHTFFSGKPSRTSDRTLSNKTAISPPPKITSTQIRGKSCMSWRTA